MKNKQNSTKERSCLNKASVVILIVTIIAATFTSVSAITALVGHRNSTPDQDNSRICKSQLDDINQQSVCISHFVEMDKLEDVQMLTMSIMSVGFCVLLVVMLLNALDKRNR